MVRVKNCVSRPRPVQSGVIQGSVIGPALFLFYINDIDFAVSGNILKFADDTKVARRLHKKYVQLDCDSMQNDLKALNEWAKVWDMSFNNKKFVCLHAGSSNPLNNYYLDNNVIRSDNGTGIGDLGVKITGFLKPSVHCAYIAKREEKVGYAIRRSFKHLDCELSAAVLRVS